MLRPGTIYGPGAKLPVGRFQLPSSRERPLVAGSRRVSAGLVYVDDVVDAMLAAAMSDVPTGSVYNLVDSSDCDQEELARTMREVTGGRIRPVFAPYPLVWAAMLGLDLLSLCAPWPARNRPIPAAAHAGTDAVRVRRRPEGPGLAAPGRPWRRAWPGSSTATTPAVSA